MFTHNFLSLVGVKSKFKMFKFLALPDGIVFFPPTYPSAYGWRGIVVTIMSVHLSVRPSMGGVGILSGPFLRKYLLEILQIFREIVQILNLCLAGSIFF